MSDSVVILKSHKKQPSRNSLIVVLFLIPTNIFNDIFDFFIFIALGKTKGSILKCCLSKMARQIENGE